MRAAWPRAVIIAYVNTRVSMCCYTEINSCTFIALGKQGIGTWSFSRWCLSGSTNKNKSSHLTEEWECFMLVWLMWKWSEPGRHTARRWKAECVKAAVCVSHLLWSLPGGLCAVVNAMTGWIIPLLLKTSPPWLVLPPPCYNWPQHCCWVYLLFCITTLCVI